jgi:hypothetical protein
LAVLALVHTSAMARENLALFKLPPHADFRDGYFLRKCGQERWTPCPEFGRGKGFSSDWEVVREHTPAYAARTGRRFADALTPYGKPNNEQAGVGPRWSLRVELRGQDGSRKERPFGWLLAVALKKAEHDARGRPCAPHYVAPTHWSCYEGDHWPIADNFDCRLANLRPLHVDRHRHDERFNWPGRTLPRSSRGIRRPLAVLLRAAARAKAKPKAKAKGKAKTRPWQR